MELLNTVFNALSAFAAVANLALTWAISGIKARPASKESDVSDSANSPEKE